MLNFPFPTELLLQILSYLPIREIISLSQASRAWKTFIRDNEDTIYHALAILHDFVKPHQQVQDCKGKDAFSFLEDVASWKELFQEHYELEMRWIGKMPCRHGEIVGLRPVVHRFKIDEEQRTVIATLSTGGLEVVSIEDAFLWTIQREEVSANAHCEYDGGFLIFDKLDSNLEVWRRQRDSQSHPLPSWPDARQQAAARNATQSLTSIRQDNRGAFVPFMVISPPNITRAFRFVYPTLLVASEAGQEAYLYDVPTGELIQRISLEVDGDSRIEITYVELSARHVFVCTASHGLLIFSRDPSACDLPFFRFHHEPRPAFADAFEVHTFPRQWPLGLVGLPLIPLQLKTDRVVGAQHFQGDKGLAVHVSPCGSHLAYATHEGYLFIIRHFEHTLRQPVLPRCSALVICTFSPITYIAFDKDRIAFYTMMWGILIVPFTSTGHNQMDSVARPSEISRPEVYYAFEHFFLSLDEPWLDHDYCTCVQLTQTGVWFSLLDTLPWHEDQVEVHPTRRVRFIDFSGRSPS